MRALYGYGSACKNIPTANGLCFNALRPRRYESTQLCLRAPPLTYTRDLAFYTSARDLHLFAYRRKPPQNCSHLQHDRMSNHATLQSPLTVRTRTRSTR